MNLATYLKLVDELNQHSINYYVDNRPTITDQEYDEKFHELQAFEKENPSEIADHSPTQRVGSDLLTGFAKVVHNTPMLSMDNSYNKDELFNFDKRVKKELENDEIQYSVEAKMDGIAVSIIYEDGSLVRATTRGNGEQGDDITAPVKTIKCLPLKINGSPEGTLEVRGEIFFYKKDFEKLNTAREEAGEALFANPRNAAGGTLKLLDTKETSKRGLSVNIYSVSSDNLAIDHHSERLSWAKSVGLPVSDNRYVCASIDDAYAEVAKMETTKDEFDYPIDGSVIKVDRIDYQKFMGETAKDYRWLIAYKFKADNVETKLLNVEFSMGRLGTVTPVANVETVNLAGSNVSNASLHNFDEIERLGVAVNDIVNIEKSGEIIPKITSVAKRTEDRIEIIKPVNCPICETKLVIFGEVALRCPNAACPDKVFRSIVHFASISACNIDHLGPGVVKKLIEHELLTSILDLYTLKRRDMMYLEGFGEKSADNIIAAIEVSKQVPAHRVLNGLGITNLGEKSSKLICKEIESLNDLLTINCDKLETIDEIGPTIAASIVTFFKDDKNIETLKSLEAFGFNLSTVQEEGATLFAGKKFVFTGNLGDLKRPKAKELVEGVGGEVSSAISKNTDFLVAGEKAGSKLKKAESLGVKVLSKDEFLSMIEGDKPDSPAEQIPQESQGSLFS